MLQQLRRDPRTIALLIVVPCFLIFITDQLFADEPQVFQQIGVPLLGLFPLISMFLVTSITMLRERTSGTLERLLAIPVAKARHPRSATASRSRLSRSCRPRSSPLVGFGLLDLTVVNPKALVIALAVANAILGMALGLLVSAFARTEFQAVQFMPAFILPQILLCGLLVPRDEMAEWLQVLSALLPMTYAYDALSRAASDVRRWVLASGSTSIVVTG